MLSVSRGSVVQSRSRAVFSAALLVVVEAGHQAVRREDGQAGVLQRDEAHQDVVGARLLLLVDAGGLVAVMAVGDQQLGVLERGLEGRRSRRRRRSRQSLWTVPSSSVTSPQGALSRERLDGVPGGVRRVVVEAEDGGEVRARGAREPQPVLLRARVRALVRADAAGAVVLDRTRAKTPWRVRGRPSGPV